MSVALDGQEAELIFIDHPSNEMSVSKNTLFELGGTSLHFYCDWDLGKVEKSV